MNPSRKRPYCAVVTKFPWIFPIVGKTRDLTWIKDANGKVFAVSTAATMQLPEVAASKNQNESTY